MSGRPTPPRLALRPDEAAASIGVSRDFFDERVGSHLRWFRAGRLKLVRVSELDAFLEKHSALVFDCEGGDA